MSNERYEWHGHIKAVEHEYEATRLALERLFVAIVANPAQFPKDVPPARVRNALDSAEATYIVRLFAVFETGLREFWKATKQNDPPSRMRDLVNGVGSNRSIPSDVIEKAHDVREYRNSLLHADVTPSQPITIFYARGRLSEFFSFLPPTW